MRTEIKQKWVDALLSGDYAQTNDCLHNADGFCCLGVLCDIHSTETGNRWERGEDGFESLLYLGMDGALPEEVVEWAGLNETDPVIQTSSELAMYKNRLGGKFCLSELNDDLRWSFKDIAKKAVSQL